MIDGLPLSHMLGVVGFLVSFVIGGMAMHGYKNTGSPVLFRLSAAFVLIGVGFVLLWLGEALYPSPAQMTGAGSTGQLAASEPRYLQTAGAGSQAAGLALIAFSHGIKAFMPKRVQFRSIVPVAPLFLMSVVHFEHLFKSISFILLAYIVIETVMSYFGGRQRNSATAIMAAGFVMLAAGEFMGWYAYVYPGIGLYEVSMAVKITGLGALLVPFGRIMMVSVNAQKSEPK